MPKILLIDDDAQLGPPLAEYFSRFELDLELAGRPSEGLAKLRSGDYDAAILDVMLPEMDGFALCRLIRKGSDIPIIMLTARGELTDRVVGLELGARLHTLLRRQRAVAPAAQRLRFDGLELDLDTHTVIRQGEVLSLTGTEFALLVLLAREPGKVFSRDDILNHLRGHEADLYSRAVDILISRLRKKLDPLDGIRTLRNAGYALALARV